MKSFKNEDDERLQYELEADVIAGLLLEGTDRAFISECTSELEAKHFYKSVNQKIYEALREVHKETPGGLDLVTLSDRLDREGTLKEIGGTSYLAEITSRSESYSGLKLQSMTRAKIKSLIDREAERSRGQAINKIKSIAAGSDSFKEKIFKIQGFLSELERSGTSRAAIPEVYNFKKYESDILRVTDGLRTGYPSLNRLVSIPLEALTIIAGRPSHGKTTFLLNLFNNMINEYKEKSFFFFSYEQTNRQLLGRLINLLGNKELSKERNQSQIENYIRSVYRKAGGLEHREILDAMSTLTGLVDEGRLHLINEPYDIDSLVNVFNHLAREYDIGAIYIDYIQKIKIKGASYSRQNEIQKISERLLESSLSLGLPIILGAQFNREVKAKKDINEGKLREAGDIEQDANLVLGLWNGAKAKEDEGHSPGPFEVDLDILVLKNRDGRAPAEVTLRFNRPVLRIYESGTLSGNGPAF